MSSDAATDDVIQALTEAWAEVFETEVTADSDFFALGGDSLCAVSIAAMMAERYPGHEQLDVFTLEAIFEHGSVAAIAADVGQFLAASPSVRDRA